jgi:hypothetical protein
LQLTRTVLAAGERRSDLFAELTTAGAPAWREPARVDQCASRHRSQSSLMLTDSIMDHRLHPPARPGWNCQDCGQPWPCGFKRAALTAEYRDDRTSLLIYLAYFLVEAIDDFGRPDGGPLPNLYARILGWASQPAALIGSHTPATVEAGIERAAETSPRKARSTERSSAR